jgi:hypothetical protein
MARRVAEAIDGLYACGRIVDGGGERADRDIHERPETERRVLHERAFPADQEKPGGIGLASWRRRKGS